MTSPIQLQVASTIKNGINDKCNLTTNGIDNQFSRKEQIIE